MNKYQQQTLNALIGYLQYSPIKDFDFILQQLLILVWILLMVIREL